MAEYRVSRSSGPNGSRLESGDGPRLPDAVPDSVTGAVRRPDSPGRAEVIGAVTSALTRCAGRWAWQGPADARRHWPAGTGTKALDLWFDPASAASDPVAAIRAELACARVAAADDRRRPRQVSLAIETATGVAVVDLSYGDLCVGPVLLVPADEIGADPATHQFTGVAAVADLLVRPVLGGRVPPPERLDEARREWSRDDRGRRERMQRRLGVQLGWRVAAELVAIAQGSCPNPGLPRRARLRLVAAGLTRANASATWRRRRPVLPAAHRAGPLGLPVRGVVVALVGTEGAGKSTVAGELRDRLQGLGLRTAPAAERRASPAGRGASPGPRQAAPWFSAGEHLWRYLSTVVPALVQHRVVIVDRCVYDLRDAPWPGSAAGWLAERLVPSPDVLVLPDAPSRLIHLRKPERPLAEQEVQQERFRTLLAERPARCAELIVDTSGGTPDPLAALVAAVMQAAHQPRSAQR
jgi:thymidylate kinase